MDKKIFVIGFDESWKDPVGSVETKEQIELVKQYELDLWINNKKVIWTDFDDPEDQKTILQAVVNDRILRVDQKNIMSYQPPFAVFVIQKEKIVRLEFYEGHDTLTKSYDLRSKELEKMDIQDFLEHSKMAYEPSEFLEKTIGIPKEVSTPILKKNHDEKEK